MTLMISSETLPAQARYATPRSDLATFGPAVDQVMALLGHPPMPWQSQVNAVANEVNEDGTYRYKTIVCSTPRQAGKTSLLGGVMAHRAMTQRDFRGWYTAQTGQAARDTWYEWQRKIEMAMPRRWQFRLSNGEESARWPTQGSFIRTFPPTPASLHGRQGDLILLDEVFSLSMELGEAIMQATIPTQATRSMRQTWIVSTAGTEESDWMRGWIEKGRDSLSDPASTIAHFEWTAPEEAPYDDPETWRLYHPAYGLTQSEESFRIALEQLGEAGFRRGMLNQWPAISTSWRQRWGTLPENGIPAGAQVFIAADSCPRHTKASIVAAAPGDPIPIEVIDHHAGIDWVLPRLTELHQRHACEVLIVRTGPLGHLILDLERSGVRVRAVTSAEFQDAVSTFQTLTVADGIAHPRDPRLDQAVANSMEVRAERPTWRRKDHGTDISPLVAASLAVWAAATPVGMQIF